MVILQTNQTSGDFGLTHIDQAGNQLLTDLAVEGGGNGKGFRPMQALLAALVGCSEVDIISILKKQKRVINDAGRWSLVEQNKSILGENVLLSITNNNNEKEAINVWNV